MDQRTAGSRQPIVAAQYIRMSTEHQRYSLENQMAALGVYALNNGIRIVKTYRDHGRSGLTLKGRAGLQSLLADVMSTRAPFSAVLVLDVSRWGRFQDTDESATYEFLCKMAGVQIHYTGEPFLNDGSPTASLIKHVKRIMAGEFARELGVKIKAGQQTQTRLGNYVGSRAAYGLRRQLVTEDGTPRQIMARGQRKAIATERIRLVHGPDEEVQAIRDIYDLYLSCSIGALSIARQMAAEGRPPPVGGWTQSSVMLILRYEGYVGEVFYGKSTRPLQGEKLDLPRDEWIGGVTFPPIVSRETFDAARRKRTSRRRYFPRDDLLERLRNCRDEFGYLSTRIIEDCPYLPSASAIAYRFGSLPAAYVAAGLPHAIMIKGRLHRVRLRRQSKEAILQGLRRLWDDKGFVNYKLINACDYLPHADSIASRFNGLTKAYEQAGLPYRLQDICRAAKLRNGLAAAGIVDKPPRRPNVTRNADGSPFTDEQLAEILRRLAAEHGYLTERLIMLTPGVPKASFFRTRFGSLEQAYAAAGWAASRSDFMRSAIARSRGGALKPYEPWEDEVATGSAQSELRATGRQQE